jgi:hypothetical protein
VVVHRKGRAGINAYAYYPMSSGYESGGYGLINLDGTLTERAVSTGNIGRVVVPNQSLLLAARPVPARVAIVYNPLAQMVGGAQRRGDWPEAHANSLMGYYRVFAQHNIPVDFIHRNELEQGDVSQYELIVVPYALMFTESAAAGCAASSRRAATPLRGAPGVERRPRLRSRDHPGRRACTRSSACGRRTCGCAAESELDPVSGVDHELIGRAGSGALRGSLHVEHGDAAVRRRAGSGDGGGEPAVVASRFGGGRDTLHRHVPRLGQPPRAARRYHARSSGRLADWAGIEKPVTPRRWTASSSSPSSRGSRRTRTGTCCSSSTTTRSRRMSR